jgi:hypothetical protein
MAEQSFANHAHRPTHTIVVWLFGLAALGLIVMQGIDGYRDWAIIALILAVLELGWISRAYTVKLQDRVIMLEMKVRAAEILSAGQDAQLAKLSVKQIAALRFASDEELGALLERAVRENMDPKDIKASIRTWRPDLHRT